MEHTRQTQAWHRPLRVRFFIPIQKFLLLKGSCPLVTLALVTTLQQSTHYKRRFDKQNWRKPYSKNNSNNQEDGNDEEREFDEVCSTVVFLLFCVKK